MKSCDQSRDRFNLIETISDHYWSRISWGWFSHQSPNYLTFAINLLTFRSTFHINHLNQHFESTYIISLLIKSAAPLVCGMLLSLTNVRTWESTPTYWDTYDLGSWSSCRSPTYRGVKHITLEYPLVAVWIKALLDTTRTFPLCKHQLCFQESQNDENDKCLGFTPILSLSPFTQPDAFIL